MTITRRDIKAQFPRATSVEQEGSKQLFTVHNADGSSFILSYATIIGFQFAGSVYLTLRKYSHTTSAHQALVRRDYGRVIDIDDAFMWQKLDELKLGV